MNNRIRRQLGIVVVLVFVAMPAAPAPAQQTGLELVTTIRYPSGTDIDFSGRFAYAGSLGDDGGVHIVDISKNVPKQVGFIRCPGSQNDTAVVRPGLLALGYHQGGCVERKSGVRLIDVSNPRSPRILGAVDMAGGTHTLTVYPGQPIIYSSPGGAGAPETIIDVSDPRNPKIAATFDPAPAGCHDVSFHFTKNEKLGFCAGDNQTQIWDVTKPLKPEILGSITTPLNSFHHSAVASPDGKYLAVGDEAILTDCVGGPTGMIFIYDITDRSAPREVSRISPPARGGPPLGTYCTAHNFNFIGGTRKLVVAWYEHGTNVIDLSDPANPREIAFFLEEDSNTWSSYWYRGRIYANDLGRGLDVLKLAA